MKMHKTIAYSAVLCLLAAAVCAQTTTGTATTLVGTTTNLGTISGGAVNPQSVQAVLYASEFSGSDIGVKVNAAFAIGAAVVIPPGSYSLSTPLVVPGGDVLYLPGPVTLTYSNLSSSQDGITLTDQANVGAKIVGPGTLTVDMASTGRDGIRVCGGGHPVLKNIMVENSVGNAFTTAGCGAYQWTQNFLYENLKAQNVEGDAFHFEINQNSAFINGGSLLDVETRHITGHSFGVTLNAPTGSVSEGFYDNSCLHCEFDAGGGAAGTITTTPAAIYINKLDTISGDGVDELTLVNGDAEDTVNPSNSAYFFDSNGVAQSGTSLRLLNFTVAEGYNGALSPNLLASVSDINDEGEGGATRYNGPSQFINSGAGSIEEWTDAATTNATCLEPGANGVLWVGVKNNSSTCNTPQISLGQGSLQMLAPGGVPTPINMVGPGGGGGAVWSIVSDVNGVLDTASSYAGSLALFGTTDPATSGGNATGTGIGPLSRFWNGSASARDYWYLVDTMGAGANPTATLTLHHDGDSGGTSGVKSVDFTAASNVAVTALTVGGAQVYGALSGTLTASTTAVGANSCGDAVTATISGATTSMAVSIGMSGAPQAGLRPYAYISSSSTITFEYCNDTASSITPNAQTVEIRVVQ